jgi:hypothetical protein
VDDRAFAPDSFVRIFGKPESHEGRRMAVVLTMAASESEALAKAKERIGYIGEEEPVTPKRNEETNHMAQRQSKPEQTGWFQRLFG